jgi:hypothetical protein
VVERGSAVIDGSEAIGFEAKHRELQRFASREDNGYKSVLFWLRLMVGNASGTRDHSTQGIFTHVMF